jgi:DNA-binding CsgD family transcriptional regulator
MPTEFGAFDKLTEAFSAAAVDPVRWEAAMDVASSATGSFGALLLSLPRPTPGLQKSASLGELVEDYIGNGWIQRDERTPAIPTILRRGVSSDFDFTTSDSMARSPYYQDLLGRHRLKWFACVKMGEGEDVWGLSLQRTSVQGPFSPDELRRLAGLSRRLAGAAALARAFGRARVETAIAAFDASRIAVAAIDRSGEVLRLNVMAERLLGPDLRVVKKRFVSFNRDATAALDRALHALIWAKGEAFHPPVVLPRRAGRPMIAYPSRLPAEALIGLTACVGFVVLVDPDCRLSPDGEALVSAFRLTPAEARLAIRFLAKGSLEAAAKDLGVSIETARNQLKSVYQKTGVRRHGEIIALLSRLARF